MAGGGINGYLQGGNAESFWRGFVAGAIPQDLGFTEAYLNNALANIGIGIVRDGIRGYVVGGREGISQGIGIGQFNNLVGHLVGFITSGFRGPIDFKDGAFIYEGSFWETRGAITLGNVISGPAGLSTTPELFGIHYAHERDHMLNPVEQGLGALYGPAHIIDLAVGHTGRMLNQGNSWFILEEHIQRYPYSTLPPWPL